MKIFTRDKFATVCIASIAMSLIIFTLGALYQPQQSAFGVFIANYLISIGLTVAVFIKARKEPGRSLSNGKLTYTIYMLLAWFVSAFALNREMNVFDDSTPWLCVWILVSSGALMFAVNFERLHSLWRLLLFFLTGAALLLFVYYSLYLMPLYIVSIPGLLAIGIAIHSYIPLFLAMATVALIIKACRADKRVLYAAAAGFIMPLAGAVTLVVMWSNKVAAIDAVINQNTLSDGKLPAWVAVSREIQSDFITERIMKAGLVYHEVLHGGDFFFGGLPSRSFDARREHDPLVVLSTLFVPGPNLGESERINILKAMYNSRHQAQERLWNGDQLQTASVVTNVLVYPQYRLAYTEKTLMIRNNSRWEWNNAEAIYTFHLPEGSVVSSLSLWIDGREERSRLTTKAKADSAYKTVVGVEQHDPSVIHWQEGNTVTLRVFPCPSKEVRQVRIGITSPLRLSGERLVYDNSWFEGPDASGALETAKLSFSTTPDDLTVPAPFERSADTYTYAHSYRPEWEVSFKAGKMTEEPFNFNGTSYQLRSYQPSMTSFIAASLYLDVNSSWTRDEYRTVLQAAAGRPVYVYRDKLIRVTTENADSVYDALSSQTFSLFPFHVITSPQSAVVITKNNGLSPALADLKGSEFGNELTASLKTAPVFNVYNLSDSITPYLRVLKEMRVLNYLQGSTDELSGLLLKKRFAGSQENDSTVVLGASGVKIVRTSLAAGSHAPDHLMRLFAYNDIMKKIGPDYFRNEDADSLNIAEAEKAYIVTPVSSMIVLETDNDYKRFGIDENKEGLNNASMKSSGAAPEPQEWVLIILGSAIIATFLYRSKKAVPQL